MDSWTKESKDVKVAGSGHGVNVTFYLDSEKFSGHRYSLEVLEGKQEFCLVQHPLDCEDGNLGSLANNKKTLHLTFAANRWHNLPRRKLKRAKSQMVPYRVAGSKIYIKFPDFSLKRGESKVKKSRVQVAKDYGFVEVNYVKRFRDEACGGNSSRAARALGLSSTAVNLFIRNGRVRLFYELAAKQLYGEKFQPTAIAPASPHSPTDLVLLVEQLEKKLEQLEKRVSGVAEKGLWDDRIGALEDLGLKKPVVIDIVEGEDPQGFVLAATNRLSKLGHKHTMSVIPDGVVVTRTS